MLHLLGNQGCTVSTTRSTHFVGYGRHYLYCKMDLKAICSFRDKALFWDDAVERESISKQIVSEYDFPNCVGMGDGTLFPLAFTPSSDYASDYSVRNHG